MIKNVKKWAKSYKKLSYLDKIMVFCIVFVLFFMVFLIYFGFFSQYQQEQMIEQFIDGSWEQVK